MPAVAVRSRAMIARVRTRYPDAGAAARVAVLAVALGGCVDSNTSRRPTDDVSADVSADGEVLLDVSLDDAEDDPHGCDPAHAESPCVCGTLDDDVSGWEAMQSRYCCDVPTEAPFLCLPELGNAATYIWQDMSEFGSICGGRDFPYANALPACPWDEESP